MATPAREEHDRAQVAAVEALEQALFETKTFGKVSLECRTAADRAMEALNSAYARNAAERAEG